VPIQQFVRFLSLRHDFGPVTFGFGGIRLEQIVAEYGRGAIHIVAQFVEDMVAFAEAFMREAFVAVVLCKDRATSQPMRVISSRLAKPNHRMRLCAATGRSTASPMGT
jgi:hypothetical protein